MIAAIASRLGRLLDRPRGRLLVQFMRFGLVGVGGLAVDTAVLYAILWSGAAEFPVARALSFLCAVTATWALNRSFTFRDAVREPPHRQWAKFAAANGIGGAVNIAVSLGLEANVAVVAAYPVLAVCAGSVAGLLFNFFTSRWLVFRQG
ncbi:GtrA family protein [Azospirillum sp. SYSU D00513]|uniref:GtrA family protein n=1 Tax=Azospirillum sp. SYSU D00513 TaxID=2812561 RepID=UPI001A95F6BB|nr:GtrA family protein [Azospirillum sp. SYSU D00513]